MLLRLKLVYYANSKAYEMRGRVIDKKKKKERKNIYDGKK